MFEVGKFYDIMLDITPRLILKNCKVLDYENGVVKFKFEAAIWIINTANPYFCYATSVDIPEQEERLETNLAG